MANIFINNKAQSVFFYWEKYQIILMLCYLIIINNALLFV